MAKNTWDSIWDSGAAASRPSAGDVAKNAYYLATDTGVLSQSDGISTWTTIATFGLGSGATFSDLGWFNVEDYGAVHDNATDDAAAIEAALDACIAAGGGTVYFPNGTYLVSRAMQSTGTFNSQIRIQGATVSSSSEAPISIRLLGEAPVTPTSGAGEPSGGSVIRSDWDGSISGHPAIFSAGLWGTVPSEAGPQVRFEDIGIQYHLDPKLSAIQMQAASSLSLHRVLLQPSVDASAVTAAPTHSNAVGVDMPIGLASQFPDSLYDVAIEGIYTGLAPSEQANGTDIAFAWCVQAVLFRGAQGSPTFTRHANYFGKVLASLCNYGLVFTGDERWVFISMFNAEHDAAPFNTTYDIDDGSNYARGFVGLHTTDYSTGPDEPLMNGASGLSYVIADKMRWRLATAVDIPTGTNPATNPTNGRRLYAASATGHLSGRDSSGAIVDYEMPKMVALDLVNKSGGSVAAGDVVVLGTANDGAFTTTTTGQSETTVGIAQESIANNATGKVLVSGYAALVNVPSSVTRYHYIETHAVVKQATGSSTRRAGSFGQFLTGGTTPTAILWGQTDQTASSGSSLTVEEVDGSPTDSAVTKIKFPNGTLSISSHEATYTPASVGSAVAEAHGFQVYRDTSDQSVGNNTFTAVQWNQEVFDTDNGHDNSTNNTRYTIPSITGVTTGLWRFKTSGYTNATGNRADVKFRKNNTTDSPVIIGPTCASGAFTFESTWLAVLSATDYIEVFVRTTAGSFSVVATDATAQPQFEGEFLGKVT